MKYIAFALLLLVGCTQTKNEEKVVHTSSSNSGKLVHTVFFKLKPDADKQVLINSIEKFKTVDVIKHVEVGTFEDTGNPKTTLSEHTIIMQLTFDDLAAFRVYEKHPTHLASINDTKDLLAGPPIGYDYFVK